MLSKKFFLILFITLLTAIYLNLIYHQYRDLTKGNNLVKQGKYIWAIDYYSYVILSYTPFSPYMKKAEKNILKLGDMFQQKQDLYGSLFAYETLRASYFQVRSFYQPRQDLIDKLNYKIAKLKVEILKNENRPNNAEDEYKRQLKILKHNDFPSTISSLILCLSFVAWIGSIIFMILQGFKYEKANKKIILISFASYLLFFLIWIMSLFWF
jgi:hypothetical protein